MDAGLNMMKVDKEDLRTRSETEDACGLCDIETAECTERETIHTIEDAIRFLEGECSYLAVPLEIEATNWKVVSLDGEFEEVFTEDKLINFARHERDRAHGLYAQVSDEPSDPFPTSGGAT